MAKKEARNYQVRLSVPRWMLSEIAAGLRNRAYFHEGEGSNFLARRLREKAQQMEEKANG